MHITHTSGLRIVFVSIIDESSARTCKGDTETAMFFFLALPGVHVVLPIMHIKI